MSLPGVRQNVEFEILKSQARTSTTTVSKIFDNHMGRGAIFYFDVTAIAGADITGFEIQVPVGTGFKTIHIISWLGVDINSVGLFAALVYPGVSSTGSFNALVANSVMPNRFRIQVNAVDTSSVTYSVSCHLIM